MYYISIIVHGSRSCVIA